VISVDATPKVSCIVLNWNGWEDTLRCLAALEDTTYKNLQMIVVDNHSTDDSVERIKNAHPDTLVIEASANLGFAGGNNLGIRYALENGTEYVWLLNNDTVPAASALSELVSKALADRRTAGLLGQLDGDGVDRAGPAGCGRQGVALGFGFG